MRWLWAGVLVLLFGGAIGWAVVTVRDTDRVAGCHPPAHEDDLLDAYAHDPVLAIRPAGSGRVGGGRERACRKLSFEDDSITSITLHLSLSREYDEAALRAIYEPVATRNGWAVDPARSGGMSGPDDIYLVYCRRVRGVVSELTVNAWPTRYNGGMILTIAAAPWRAAC